MNQLQFLVVLDDLVIIQSVNEPKMSDISTSWFKNSDQHFPKVFQFILFTIPDKSW